ncbi:MAG: ThiF family adenylyltransferase [Terrimesophilobacter sp.]
MASIDPLVLPGASLDPQRLARFSRQLSLPGFDEVAQRRLANARVLVIGAGGLGSATVPYLASAGIGTIGIIDTDVVELSNLHRQIVHGVADIGRSKLDSIEESVAAIDPTTKVICYRKHLDSSNILGILADYDVLLDGSDNFPTRYLANDAAVLSAKPLVWGAILRYSGQVSVSWAQHGPTYRDLFPSPPPPGSVPSCAEGGVLPSVCAVIGAIMSAETIKIITGIGQPLLGTVTTYDALTGRFRELAYGRSDEVAPVTKLIDYQQFCGIGDEITAAGDTLKLANNLTAEELARLIEQGGELQLVDIRESYERAIAAIEPSDFLPLGSLMEQLDSLRRDAPVVLYCHSGGRSAHALRLLQNAGFDNVSHLSGGIDNYSVKVDPTLVRY